MIKVVSDIRKRERTYGSGEREHDIRSPYDLALYMTSNEFTEVSKILKNLKVSLIKKLALKE